MNERSTVSPGERRKGLTNRQKLGAMVGVGILAAGGAGLALNSGANDRAVTTTGNVPSTQTTPAQQPGSNVNRHGSHVFYCEPLQFTTQHIDGKSLKDALQEKVDAVITAKGWNQSDGRIGILNSDCEQTAEAGVLTANPQVTNPDQVLHNTEVKLPATFGFTQE